MAIQAGKLLARRLCGADNTLTDYVNVCTTVFLTARGAGVVGHVYEGDIAIRAAGVVGHVDERDERRQ